MEAQATIDIIIFPEREETDDKDGSIRAQSDKVLPYSIISEGMINQLGVKYTSCQKEAVNDSRNVQHVPVGQVDLRWHKKDQGKTHSETFFVVGSTTPLVILGATAFPNSNQSAGSNIYPIGVQQQTTGLIPAFVQFVEAANILSLTEDEKKALDQKRLEAAQRREQEKREQEEKESERRRQLAQKKY
ncbi:MAG: hypothetical protein Q9181_007061 [Wetmoreana brouardii]